LIKNSVRENIIVEYFSNSQKASLAVVTVKIMEERAKIQEGLKKVKGIPRVSLLHSFLAS
jgi:uncharacterized protein with HEPN domain